jgi:hypothetical protein
VTDRGDVFAPGVEPDPALAELADEVARRLLRGESVDPSSYDALHPGESGPIRALLPTMEGLAELGRSVALGRDVTRRTDHPHTRATEPPSR